MCGIAGLVGGRAAEPETAAVVRRMAATLEHRGPDGEGHFADQGCALGFQRLAILDVAAKAPPFPNEDGSVWSMANAEIYNSAVLRRELEGRGHSFRTGVDSSFR